MFTFAIIRVFAETYFSACPHLLQFVSGCHGNSLNRHRIKSHKTVISYVCEDWRCTLDLLYHALHQKLWKFSQTW